MLQHYTNAPKLISLTVLVEECYSVIDSQIIKSLISRWRPELAQLSRVGIECTALHWSSVKTFPLLLMILWIDLLLFVHSVNCFYPLTDKQFAVCEMWRMAVTCQWQQGCWWPGDRAGGRHDEAAADPHSLHPRLRHRAAGLHQAGSVTLSIIAIYVKTKQLPGKKAVFACDRLSCIPDCAAQYPDIRAVDVHTWWSAAGAFSGDYPRMSRPPPRCCPHPSPGPGAGPSQALGHGAWPEYFWACFEGFLRLP